MFLMLADWHVIDPTYTNKSVLEYCKPIEYDNIQDGDVIFVQMNQLQKFLSTDISRISCKIKLITHNGDTNINNNYNRYLSDTITQWWSTNCDSNDPRMNQIPIGLQCKNLYYIGNPQGDDSIINSAKKVDASKCDDVLLTFNKNTNLYHRTNVYNYFINKNFVNERCYTQDDRSNVDFIIDYLVDIKRHKFVLCPWGNGYDCHRNWEVMYMGSIPIIQKHPSLKYYKDLPVWLVDDWSIVTKENLDRKFLEITSKNYNLDKLYFNYWKEKIHSECI